MTRNRSRVYRDGSCQPASDLTNNSDSFSRNAHRDQPTLIIVGTQDCLLDDSRGAFTRMRTAGVDATLVEIPGGFHGFTLLPSPESKHVRQRVSTFVGAVLGDR